MKIILTESQIKNLVFSLNEEDVDTNQIKAMSPNLTKAMTGLYDMVSKMKDNSPTSDMSKVNTDNLKDITTKYVGNDGSSTLSYPLRRVGRISGGFGEDRTTHSHKGVDIATPSGSEVLCPADGIVEEALDTTPNGCGGMVKINHGNLFTKFCHLKQWLVSNGQTVKKGQVIGYSGGARTDQYHGSSTGPHLHYEILDSTGLAVKPSIAANDPNLG
jgi:murein DD-endopeptidase MepM/ murein hydrolase activator NlpD